MCVNLIRVQKVIVSSDYANVWSHVVPSKAGFSWDLKGGKTDVWKVRQHINRRVAFKYVESNTVLSKTEQLQSVWWKF